jgi:uncharacterized protein (DUF2384 family)
MAVARKRVLAKSRATAQRAWNPLVAGAIAVRSDAPRAFDVTVKLERLVATFGQNAAAGLLGLDAGQMRRCLKGQEKISAPIAQRIVDLEYVVDRALRVFYPDEVGPWLSQPEPLLGGAIPLNVLVLRGSSPVIAALSRIAAGAFA